MSLRCQTLWIAAALAAALLPARAQTAAPAPSAASAPASAPQPARPGPRLQTPTELREGATAPGDLRPEERVTPQIVIPLRKATPPMKAERGAARRGIAASAAGIDDTAARCEAESSDAARAACRASLPPRPSPPRKAP